MDLTDLFGILHAPARIAGRILLSPQYLFSGIEPIEWRLHNYAKGRYGAHYRWKPWLLFDIEELEHVANMINDATDDEILRLRDSHLDVTKLVAVVAALIAQAALSSLSLPKLEQTHWAARALLTGSLILGLQSIFFTCVQQRVLGLQIRPDQVRSWLSSGKEPSSGRLQSSLIAHQLLQAPFEMLGVSVTMFVAGLGVYEGSGAVRNIGLNTMDGKPVGNIGVLVPFIVGTVFGCFVLGFLTGRKNSEDYMQRISLPTSTSASVIGTALAAESSVKIQKTGIPGQPQSL